jgi:hypothetical protein
MRDLQGCIFALLAGVLGFVCTIGTGYGIGFFIWRANKDGVSGYVIVMLAFVLAFVVAPFAMIYGARFSRALNERKGLSRGFPVAIHKEREKDENL